MPSLSPLETGRGAAAAAASSSASAAESESESASAAAAAATSNSASASAAAAAANPDAAAAPADNPEQLATPSSASPSPSSPSPSVSPRPGFLSRLGLPLRNRSRNVTDFHIRPDEPYRTYVAGDHVRGNVVFAIIKPLRITHLVVALNGFVRVHKDPAAVAKTRGGASSSGKPLVHGNGFASLFQDEQALSGDGRLAPGRYEFGFDLVFPDKGLPSSIDFERGTISYVITATITRPTSIAPTTTCDRRVVLVDRVDIGLLPQPQPNRFFLEPRPKRTRRKRSALGLDKAPVATPVTAPEVNDAGSEAGSMDPSVATEDSGRDQPEEPRSADLSDIRSDISGESGVSASTGLSRSDFVQLSQVGTGFTSAKQQQAYDNKTITATIELLRPGCLPGDTVSVRVTVQHIKRIKSINGVVVTLYRQTRIDTSPPSSKFEEGTTPANARVRRGGKSRSGLSGLSLSSTGTTSIFRKDLDQNMAPLIIDPVTMQTSVTMSVKLPNDSFPTIRGVPGDMVTFKYHVEVIVDLGGKLSRHVEGGKAFRAGPLASNSLEAGTTYSYGMRRGATIADTSQLRREEGLISLAMETIVGTVDSSRNRKQPLSSTKVFQVLESDEDELVRPEATSREALYPSSPPMNGSPQTNSSSAQQNGQRPFHLPPHPAGHSSYSPTTTQPEHSRPNGYPEDTPAYIPPPQLPDQARMTEKDRIRQAEARLLPSQPVADGPSSPGEESTVHGEDTPRLPPASPGVPADDDNAGEGPSAPTADDIATGDPATIEAAEDKQERERERLMAEASAPPEFPEDMQRGSRGASRRDEEPEAEPSAPVLNEDDDNDYAGYGLGAGTSRSGAARHGTEQLPAYER